MVRDKNWVSKVKAVFPGLFPLPEVRRRCDAGLGIEITSETIPPTPVKGRQSAENSDGGDDAPSSALRGSPEHHKQAINETAVLQQSEYQLSLFLSSQLPWFMWASPELAFLMLRGTHKLDKVTTPEVVFDQVCFIVTGRRAVDYVSKPYPEMPDAKPKGAAKGAAKNTAGKKSGKQPTDKGVNADTDSPAANGPVLPPDLQNVLGFRLEFATNAMNSCVHMVGRTILACLIVACVRCCCCPACVYLQTYLEVGKWNRKTEVLHDEASHPRNIFDNADFVGEHTMLRGWMKALKHITSNPNMSFLWQGNMYYYDGLGFLNFIPLV